MATPTSRALELHRIGRAWKEKIHKTREELTRLETEYSQCLDELVEEMKKYGGLPDEDGSREQGGLGRSV